jgi:hypothetical protein
MIKDVNNVLMSILLIIKLVYSNRMILSKFPRLFNLIQYMILIQNKELSMMKVLFLLLNQLLKVTMEQYLHMDKLDVAKLTQ